MFLELLAANPCNHMIITGYASVSSCGTKLAYLTGLLTVLAESIISVQYFNRHADMCFQKVSSDLEHTC